MNVIRRITAVLAALASLALLPGAHAAQSQLVSGPQLNSAARLLAGLAPTHPDHQALAQLPEWKAHAAGMQASWARVEKEHVAPLVAWRDSVIPSSCPVSNTLFYPFSGPDFFNMYWLFPNCETYVLFGLEPIGSAPRIEAMSQERFVRLIGGVREAISNVFARNYFITSRMDQQLRAPELNGVVPMFMIQMALTGVDLVSVEPLVLPPMKPEVEAAPAADGQKPRVRKLRGVTLKFRSPGEQKVQTVHFFSVDVSNNGLRNYPEFMKFLRDMGPHAGLVKSASYLLHNAEFRRIRELMLDSTGFLVQDDTGIPYSMLAKNGYQVRVFGRYREPIPPFERHFQQALAAQYEQQQPPQLGFRFGYRRASEGYERTNILVATRDKAPTKQSDAGARK